MQLPTERDRLVEARRISSCGRLRPRFRRLAPKLLWLTSMAFLLSYPLVSHVLRRTSRKARCSAPQARARAAARTPATAARPTPNVASLVGAADPSDPWAALPPSALVEPRHPLDRAIYAARRLSGVADRDLSQLASFVAVAAHKPSDRARRRRALENARRLASDDALALAVLRCAHEAADDEVHAPRLAPRPRARVDRSPALADWVEAHALAARRCDWLAAGSKRLFRLLEGELNVLARFATTTTWAPRALSAAIEAAAELGLPGPIRREARAPAAPATALAALVAAADLGIADEIAALLARPLEAQLARARAERAARAAGARRAARARRRWRRCGHSHEPPPRTSWPLAPTRAVLLYAKSLVARSPAARARLAAELRALVRAAGAPRAHVGWRVLDNDVRAEALARAAVRLGKLALAKRRHALGALLEQHAAAYQRFDIGTMAALPCTPRAAWRAAGYVMLGGASAKEALASARCLPTVERLQLAISQPFLR